MNNLLLMTDSYKPSHSRLYPDDVTHLYAYLESRGGKFQQSVFFGLQYYLLNFLEGFVFTYDDILEAADFWHRHFGRSDVFDEDAWMRLYHKHNGKLPIRIAAVEEGTVVPTHNVLMTVENTDPDFPWLVTYLETILLKLWYPITIASQSYYLRQELRRIGLEASDDIDSIIDFMVHDFGYRGVTSEESAQLAGAAHLLSFKGTDTVAGIRFLQEWYPGDTREMFGFSVPATEHSVIMAHRSEEEAFAHVLDTFPTGIVACVSDTVNIEKAVTDVWGRRFKEQIEQRNGRLVIRPDSGDPLVVPVWVVQELDRIFGSTVNTKSKKVLPDFVRVIQGDGMNVETIPALYRTLVKNGFAPDNLIVGSGGGLLQNVTRDTMKFAYKVSHVTYKDGTSRSVSKHPVTDADKASKAGRLALIRQRDTYATVPETSEINDANCLTTVFENGIMTRDTSYDEIVARMKG